MSNYRGRFVWYELMVEDQAKAKDFYGKVLNWSFDDMPMPGMDGATYVMAKSGDANVAGMMNLPPDAKAMGARPNWGGYVAVDDVDASAKRVSEIGGKVYKEPMDIPGVGRFAVIADPDGAVIMIFKGADTTMPPPNADSRDAGFVGWRELMAGDAGKVIDFYVQLFGWTKDEPFDMGPMGKYYLFSAQGVSTGGMMTKPAEVPMPYWGYYFNVDGADAAIERVKANGGQVVMGPMQVPTGEWCSTGFDNQGVYFGLLSKTK
ncbi:MAG TPA: VOC family protein [Caulobacteraceae bacterium]